MGGSLRLGKIFGITINLHWTWFFIFALITWTLAADYFPTAYPTWSLSMKIGAGLLTSFLFFASVLFHELCHSLVALREGIKIQSITLFFLGGVAQMTGEPKTAADEFRMAFAGPFSSLVLGGIFLGIFSALNGAAALSTQFGAAVAYYLGFINIFLAVFNLIPGFPLDGGRVLRSIIWWRSRNLETATRIASYIGRAFGFLFIIGGIYLFFTADFFAGIWLAFIGWFLQNAAAGSYRQVEMREALRGFTARAVMSSDYPAISPNLSLRELVQGYVLTTGRHYFVVAEEGRLKGVVTLENIKTVPQTQWGITPVKAVMTSADKVFSAHPEEEALSILERMDEHGINETPVVKEGIVLGIIVRENLLRFIRFRSELKI